MGIIVVATALRWLYIYNRFLNRKYLTDRLCSGTTVTSRFELFSLCNSCKHSLDLPIDCFDFLKIKNMILVLIV